MQEKRKKNSINNYLTLGIFITLLVGAFTFYVGAQDDLRENIFEDFDGDGLSNGEELSLGTNPHEADTDGDGYGDATEIESGYDPLKPAPGDRIIKENQELGEDKNEGRGGLDKGLTSSLTGMLQDYASTNIAEGNEYIDQEDLDSKIDEFFEQEVTLIDLPEESQNRIHIKNQEYPELSEIEREQKIREDTLEYYAALGFIFREAAPEVYDTGSFEGILGQTYEQSQVVGANPQSIDYFTDMTSQMLSGSEYLYEIAVPETLMDFHVKLLQISDYAGSTFDLQSTPDQIIEDPLSFYYNISRATSMLTLIEEVQDEWAASIEELGVDPKDLVEALQN